LIVLEQALVQEGPAELEGSQTGVLDAGATRSLDLLLCNESID
jgi:hypothetical protein